MADEDTMRARAAAQDLGLALLALAAGCMDILVFTQLGNALPSAMTGNTALLGLALGQGRLARAVPFLLAFAGFVLGAATATAMLDLARARVRVASRLLVLEAVLLAGFALWWQLAPRPIGGFGRDGLIVLAAGGMGIQGVVARLADRPGINTIVFTSTLTAIVGAATQALFHTPHRLNAATKRQIFMFAAYLLGAVAAGLFLSGGGYRAIIALPVAAVLGALVCQLRAGLPV